ncbi:chromate resistance protein [Methylolobus aquaticus]|nr:chromate resistance protein [Methylolobus aquaticus]
MSLPTPQASARMRIWRALKAAGCGVLRDGVYLLPEAESFRDFLEAQADDIRSEGGTAHVIAFNTGHQAHREAFTVLFDRSDDYRQLLTVVEELARTLASERPLGLQRRVERLRRTLAEIVAVDFFPGEGRQQAECAVSALERALSERLSPDEPRCVPGSIESLDRADFQSRVWATRCRPWIDRLASAWLIRRFIDPNARFLWLTAPGECPPDALGFDFDGARFTHVGARVTFEVLLASFSLDRDPALMRLGALVRYLDTGGLPVPEAPGMAALIRGMQQRWPDDEDLLAEAQNMFDSFYLDFAGPDT